VTFTAFYFVDVAGASRVHILAYDPDQSRWVLPCGLWPPIATRTSTLTLPLCGTCAKRTRQVPDSADLFDAEIEEVKRTLQRLHPDREPTTYRALFAELIRLESLRREAHR
jgi:hypothetical protein